MSRLDQRIIYVYSNKLNLIVTGGQDAFVRVWNPYVTKKPVSLLRGHQSPITQVRNRCTDNFVYAQIPAMD